MVKVILIIRCLNKIYLGTVTHVHFAQMHTNHSWDYIIMTIQKKKIHEVVLNLGLSQVRLLFQCRVNSGYVWLSLVPFFAHNFSGNHCSETLSFVFVRHMSTLDIGRYLYQWLPPIVMPLSQWSRYFQAREKLKDRARTFWLRSCNDVNSFRAKMAPVTGRGRSVRAG